MLSHDYALVEPLASLRDAPAGNSRFEDLVHGELWIYPDHGRMPLWRNILILKAAFLVSFREFYRTILAGLPAAEGQRLPLERLTLDHFDQYWSIRRLPYPTRAEQILGHADAGDIRALEGHGDAATIQWLRSLPEAYKGAAERLEQLDE